MMTPPSSPLPAIDRPAQLSFWQSVGIVTQLTACHSQYDQESIASYWQRISRHIQSHTLVIVFTEDHRPSGFCTWQEHTSFEPRASATTEQNTLPSPSCFNDLVFPFASPWFSHRFLQMHFHLNTLSNSILLQERVPKHGTRKIL